MIELIVDPRDPELEPLGVAVDGSRVRSYTATIRPSRTVRLAAGGFLSAVIPAPRSATTDEPVSFTVPATDGSEIHIDDRSTFTYTVDLELSGNNGRGRGGSQRVSFTGMLPTSLGATVQVTGLVNAEPLPAPFTSVQDIIDGVADVNDPVVQSLVSGASSTQTALDARYPKKGDIVVNARDFGAKGDGTTDDTAAIQAAIDSLPLNPAGDGILSPLGFANGGTILLPKGRHKITGTITLRRGTHLRGEGRESTQIVSYTAGSVFQYLDAGRYVQDELVLEDLSIWQDSSVPATSGAGVDVRFGTTSPPSTNVIMRNVIVQGCYRGTRLAAGIWSSFDNVFVANSVTNGFEVPLTIGADTSPTTSTTFKNCYASGSGGAGFHITGASYVSFVGTASDSNGTYGYHLIGGNTYTLLACGAEENALGAAYLKNTSGAVLNINAVHTTTGVRHGVSVESCDGVTLLGGTYSATTTTGYAIHVVTNGGPITTIGTLFTGNYAGNVCDSPSKFLNLTAGMGLVGGPNNHWAIGVDATPDTTATFQVGGSATSSTGLKTNPTFTVAPSGRNVAASVSAITANTAVTYPELYGLHVPNATKGDASSVARAVGVAVTEQTPGSSANAAIYLDVGGALPAGNWALYSASTRDSVFVGPVRSGSSTGPKWQSGAGSPEGAVAAPVGSMFSRTDGGAGTTFYVKESGTGNTGWVAK